MNGKRKRQTDCAGICRHKRLCLLHRALMRGETGDALFAEYLSRNYKMAPLSPRHRAMLDFAVQVLTEAEHITEVDRQALRAVGFDSRTRQSRPQTSARQREDFRPPTDWRRH